MQKRTKSNQDRGVLRDFFLGIVIFVVVQAIFMIGGLILENSQGRLINGIPSAIGLTVVLIIGLIFNAKGREYLFLGSFVLAFLAPMILFILRVFVASRIDLSLIYYSLIYSTLLVLIVYISLFIKLWRQQK